MQARNLDIEGILTSYQSEKNKHKRELVILVRPGGGLESASEAGTVLESLVQGLEDASELELSTWDKKVDAGNGLESLKSGANANGLLGMAWQQGNVKATRKQVAPLVVSLFFIPSLL